MSMKNPDHPSLKGRSPAAYAMALRGKGATMHHRNQPRGGRNNELDDILATANEERILEEAEAALQEAKDRYGFTDDDFIQETKDRFD